ncbi:MAG: histidine--tRNA ligase [Actinomycetota bacterium]|nr:histidine--tRNA ligase [Actinomycetota bacterium]MDA3003480.1 histidine--tRNA ligase [Actinomycetota bacterium]
MPEFKTSPGTRDILAPHSARWRAFQQVFASTVEAAGYNYIIPPMFEDLDVFLRLGEATEVVTKEMYDFHDKGGRHVALRPEQTASVCRAFVEHRPTTPWKVWYAGPNFRYEKPQQGRYRQFDQVGVEALGADDPLLDAEVIALASKFYTDLGLQKVHLSLNTLGDAGDREKYSQRLLEYFSSNEKDLTADSRATLARNPLRVLDSKREPDQQVIAGAPAIRDSISATASEHFEAVLMALDALNITYEINNRLVRGLDYYRRTTFEFTSTALESAHTAIGGGGRYDGLVEALGGPATPGIGFALGLDRTLLACDAEKVFDAPETAVDVFVVDTVDGRHAHELCHLLRKNEIRADRAYDLRSMKAQMKSADRSGARIALIIGSEEVENATIMLRPMGSGEQYSISRKDLLGEVRKALDKK